MTTMLGQVWTVISSRHLRATCLWLLAALMLLATQVPQVSPVAPPALAEHWWDGVVDLLQLNDVFNSWLTHMLVCLALLGTIARWLKGEVGFPLRGYRLRGVLPATSHTLEGLVDTAARHLGRGTTCKNVDSGWWLHRGKPHVWLYVVLVGVLTAGLASILTHSTAPTVVHELIEGRSGPSDPLLTDVVIRHFATYRHWGDNRIRLGAGERIECEQAVGNQRDLKLQCRTVGGRAEIVGTLSSRRTTVWGMELLALSKREPLRLPIPVWRLDTGTGVVTVRPGDRVTAASGRTFTVGKADQSPISSLAVTDEEGRVSKVPLGGASVARPWADSELAFVPWYAVRLSSRPLWPIVLLAGGSLLLLVGLCGLVLQPHLAVMAARDNDTIRIEVSSCNRPRRARALLTVITNRGGGP